MKPLALTIVFLLAYNCLGMAQDPYFWMEQNEPDKSEHLRLKKYNGSYFILSVPYNEEYEQQFSIWKVNSDAQIIAEQQLSSYSDGIRYSSDIYIHNDTIFVIGAHVESNFAIKTTLLNTSLEILKESTFAINWDYDEFSLSKLILVDNEFIATGHLFIDAPFNTDNFLYLARFDRQLDTIRTRRFLDRELYHCTPMEKPESSNFYLFTEDSHSGIVYFLRKEFNMDLEMVDMLELPSARIYEGPFSAKNVTDSTYLFSYFYDGQVYLEYWHEDNDYPTHQKGYGDLSVINRQAFLNTFDFTTPSNIYLATVHDYYSTENYITVASTALNINFPVYWEKFFGGKTWYMLTDVETAPDGGVFISGVSFDTGKVLSDAWILRLDAEGNMIPGLSTNIEEITLKDVVVYPNPGSCELHVRVAVQLGQCHMLLYDMQGRQVLNAEVAPGENTLNTAQLPAGTYIYHIQSGNQTVESGQWTKTR